MLNAQRIIHKLNSAHTVQRHKFFLNSLLFSFYFSFWDQWRWRRTKRTKMYEKVITNRYKQHKANTYSFNRHIKIFWLVQNWNEIIAYNDIMAINVIMNHRACNFIIYDESSRCLLRSNMSMCASGRLIF